MDYAYGIPLAIANLSPSLSPMQRLLNAITSFASFMRRDWPISCLDSNVPQAETFFDRTTGTALRSAHSEGDREQPLDIDAEGSRHLAPLKTGPDHGSEAGLFDRHPERRDDGETHRHGEVMSIAAMAEAEERSMNDFILSCRPGAKRKLTGQEEALLVATACSRPPEGRARWTIELLGEMVRLTEHDSVSRETVRRRVSRCSSLPLPCPQRFAVRFRLARLPLSPRPGAVQLRPALRPRLPPFRPRC